MVASPRDITRVIYHLEFVTLSELRVGTGTEEIDKDERSDVEYEIATLVQIDKDRPYIPGATLKGAFRAAAPLHEQLFGKPHEENAKQKFAKGELTFFGFSAKTQVFVKKRTAVDAGTGASEARKLFAQKFVEVGSVFAGKVVLECQTHRLDAARQEFEGVLGQFKASSGVAIAAGKADGLGRVQLSKVECETFTLGATGWTNTAPKSVLHVAAIKQQGWESIDLTCPGPYLVYGGKETKDGHEVTMPERRNDIPRLMATGVSGALRARGHWLASIDDLRNQGTLAASKCTVKTSSGDKELDVVERLFGSEGFRGSLQIRVDSIARKGESDHPAGPLDPITQSPLSGGLHHRKADYGVSFTLSLRLWRATAGQDEKYLFNALVKSVNDNGIALGLGTTKGFGWFGGAELTESAPADANAHQIPDIQGLVKEGQIPDPNVTLPYRLVEVSLDKVGMPTPAIASAASNQTLHNVPLTDGICGWVDVSWCFETPMLVGTGGTQRGPQKVGDKYALPGTTLRGAMRSVLDIATQARLGRTRHNEYKLKAGDRRRTFPLAGPISQLDGSDLHNPPTGSSYQPDFVQAMLGFIAADDRNSAQDHSAQHLKSRVSFGWAWLKHGRHAGKGNAFEPILLAPPDATSVFHDHVGRRIYPVNHLGSDDVEALLKASSRAGNADMRSQVKFLYPKEDETLVFRGRIHFHNLDPIELGALMWAITFGWRRHARHMIGQARPFGAGRSFATDIVLNLDHNLPSTQPNYDAVQDDESFGPTGGIAKHYVTLFDNWLRDHDLKTQGFRERVAAANPAVGELLRINSGLSNSQLGYQTSQTLKPKLEMLTPPKTITEIAAKNAGTSGGNRLAAMLINRKAPAR